MGQFISWNAIAEKGQLILQFIVFGAMVVLTIIGLIISIPTLMLAEKLNELLEG